MSAAMLVFGVVAFTRVMDESMQSGVKVGVVSNVVTALLFTLLGFVGVGGTVFFERRRLFRFFGISSARNTLHIYLSHLQVQGGGTTGAEPITRGYAGPAITVPEYRAALRVSTLFRSKVLALLPEGLRWLFAGVHIALSDVEPQIDVSPAGGWDPAPRINIVTIGSGVYNHVAKYYLDNRTLFYFAKDQNTGIRMLKVRASTPVKRGRRTLLQAAPIGADPDTGTDAPYTQRHSGSGQDPSGGQELGIIECIHDGPPDRPYDGPTVFVCAGVGTRATFGAVQYLVEHWSNLQHTYRRRDFVVVLGWPDARAALLPDEPDGPPGIVHFEAEIQRAPRMVEPAPAVVGAVRGSQST
jgi:hypothetical protein